MLSLEPLMRICYYFFTNLKQDHSYRVSPGDILCHHRVIFKWLSVKSLIGCDTNPYDFSVSNSFCHTTHQWHTMPVRHTRARVLRSADHPLGRARPGRVQFWYPGPHAITDAKCCILQHKSKLLVYWAAVPKFRQP